MIRSIVVTALTLAVAAASSPALAQDDVTRQLINQCVGCRLPKDLHGRDLHGLHFVGDDLRGVDFSHANLSGAVFTGCDLENAKFDDADLRNARFVGAQLAGATFARAKMDGITMRGADFGSSGSSAHRWLAHGLADADGVMSPELERELQALAAHPPTLSPEAQRELRDLERRLREMRDRDWIIVHPPVPPVPPSPAPPLPR